MPLLSAHNRSPKFPSFKLSAHANAAPIANATVIAAARLAALAPALSETTIASAGN